MTILPSTSPLRTIPPGVWSGQFILAIVVATTFAVAFNALIPLLPLYLASFGASDQEIGLVVGVFGVSALVFRPLSGQLTDRFGARRVSIVGALAFAITTPLTALSTAIPLLLVLRLVQGAGLVCFWTASTTLSMNTVHPSRTGMAMGYQSMSGGLGGLVAAPFAVQIVDAAGWQVTFLLMAALAVLSIALCGGIRTAPRLRRPAAFSRRGLVSRTTITPALFFLSWTLTQGPVLAFSSLLVIERNLGNPGVFFAVFSLGNLLVRPFAGWGADRWGRIPIALPGLVLSAVSMPLIGLATEQVWLLLWAFAYGAANGLVYTGLITWSIDRSPAEQRGSAIATFQWGWDIGSSISSAAMGVLAGFIGYGGIFVVSGVFPAVGAAVLVWAARSGRMLIPRRAAIE